MTPQTTLPLADANAVLEMVGGKGASLARLVRADLPVPDGFHVTTAAYQEFVANNDLQQGIRGALEGADPADPASLARASAAIREQFAAGSMPPEIAGAIAQAYADLPGRDPFVAVRSSATAEDLPDLSFAGQQDTYLNVGGTVEVLAAVQRCWASLWTARAIGYRMRNNIDQGAVSLAVVVQLLIPAEVAGILFTVDPMTGLTDMAAISASWGLGEAVVGGKVTPDTIIVDKGSGSIVTRETADKAVMTVRVNGGTEEQPVPEPLRRAPALSDQDAAELVRLGQRIEALYEAPMDIEWTLVDGELAIVQARPITALPDPKAPPPTEWHPPKPDGQYMRASIIDLMPNPLRPLFATLGVSAINQGLVRLVGAIARSPSVFPEETVVTINGYAYMLGQYSRAEWWWMLTKMVPKFPAMLRDGLKTWQNEALPTYQAAVARWADKPLEEMSAGEILHGVQKLLDQVVDHLGALMVGTMGIAAGTETLFTNVYNRFALREGDPEAAVLLMGYDSLPIQAEKAVYDLAQWAKDRDALAGYVLDRPAGEQATDLQSEEPPAGIPAEDWGVWRSRIHDHLAAHGHSIYDMDFTSPLPADDPTPILLSCQLFVQGKGSNPHLRQRASAERREEAVAATRARLRGLKRKIFNKTLGWAQRQAPHRENGIALVGLAYPLLRRMLREIGDRLVVEKVIEERDDVFWLREIELQAVVIGLDQATPINSLSDQVTMRKAVWAAQKQVTPPPQVPPKATYMGLKIDGVLAHGGEQDGDTIKGVGASTGLATGPARVLHGPEDFHQMHPGDILVASITTPAWTPLFAMAAAVVTDIGGPLSHGSIVAREYGIPAVLGTGVASKRIQSGQWVTVDGSAGLVHLTVEEA